MWLIAAPFVLGYRAAPAMWNDVWCGIATIVIGALVVSDANGRTYPLA